MSLTHDDVLQIMKIVDESHYERLHLELGQFKLILNKGSLSDISTRPREPSVGEHSKTSKKGNTENQVHPRPEKDGLGKTDSDFNETDEQKGLIPIRSPLLATFYRSPMPGEPPYVELGQIVEEETQVCTLEVMKLFTTVHAGVQGRIVKICANDGQMVEYDQVLFVVDPNTVKSESA